MLGLLILRSQGGIHRWPRSVDSGVRPGAPGPGAEPEPAWEGQVRSISQYTRFNVKKSPTAPLISGTVTNRTDDAAPGTMQVM